MGTRIAASAPSRSRLLFLPNRFLAVANSQPYTQSVAGSSYEDNI